MISGIHELIEKCYKHGIPLNDLIRLVWIYNPDIKATSIIRHSYRIKKKIESSDLIFPNSFNHYQRLILSELHRLGYSLTFNLMRQNGFSLEEVSSFKSFNPIVFKSSSVPKSLNRI